MQLLQMHFLQYSIEQSILYGQSLQLILLPQEKHLKKKLISSPSSEASTDFRAIRSAFSFTLKPDLLSYSTPADNTLLNPSVPSLGSLNHSPRGTIIIMYLSCHEEVEQYKSYGAWYYYAQSHNVIILKLQVKQGSGLLNRTVPSRFHRLCQLRTSDQSSHYQRYKYRNKIPYSFNGPALLYLKPPGFLSIHYLIQVYHHHGNKPDRSCKGKDKISWEFEPPQHVFKLIGRSRNEKKGSR